MKRICLAIIVAGAMMFFGCGVDDDGVPPEDIIVMITPADTIINFGDSVRFSAEVFNTPNSAVTWHVNNIAGGNDSLGTIDNSGLYESPPITEAFDNVTINAVSQEDATKSDTAAVYIRNPYFVYVSVNGNDMTGFGSRLSPFRTITKGIQVAIMDQTVYVEEGTYSENEEFPLTPGYKVKIRGADIENTRIKAPQSENIALAALRLLFSSTLPLVDSLTVVGTNGSGVGVVLSPDSSGTQLTFRDCIIDSCYLGIIIIDAERYVQFSNTIVRNCRLGLIITAGPSSHKIDNCIFSNMDSTGVIIESGADVWLGESGTPGNNTFIDFQPDKWCIYNGNDYSISAQYNTWPASDSATIDTLYIYDDDEDATKGPVIFVPFNP